MDMENVSCPVAKFSNANLKVFYRIYPVSKPKWDMIRVKNKSTLYAKKMIPIQQKTTKYWEFNTDGVFHNYTQEQVFNDVVGDLLDKLEHGQNIIIVGFGKTGIGKSVSLAGLEFGEEDYGIGPRLIQKLLELKKTIKKNKKMCIQMTNVEFSNLEVYDLFREFPNRLDGHWHVTPKLRKVKIRTEYQALKELYLAEGRKETRRVKNYMSHINSSILTFHVTTKDMDYSEPRQIVGKIHMVDMAGADTIGNLSCMFKTKLELSIANLNKSFMEQFFLALCQKSNELIKIKQRGNPFTYFIGSDIKTQSYLRFIGHITTCKEDYALTVSMLKFGQIVKGFTPTLVDLEAEISPEYKLRYLQNRVEELEREKIQNSVLFNQDLSLNMNSERMEHLSKTIKEYLHNQISEINVMTVTDATMVFKMFKEMLEQSQQHQPKETDRKPGVPTKKADSDISVVKRRSSGNVGSVKKEKRTTSKKRESVDRKQSKVPEIPEKPVQPAPSPATQFGDDTIRTKTPKAHDASSTSMSHILKKKKSKLTTAARSSPLKRRSVLSVSSTERMSDMHYVPDNVPENIEAWNEYAKTSHYNIFTEEYRANEKIIMDTYTQYLVEIKQLQEYKTQIEAMKQELLEAKILMKFKEKSTGMDQYTGKILSAAEGLCTENIEKTQKSMIEQQEIVLRCLAEIKIYLNVRKELRKRLSEDFDNYCKAKYNIPFPPIASVCEVEMIQESKQPCELIQEYVEAEEKEEGVVDYTRKERMEYLKSIMEMERKRYIKARYYSQPYK